MGDVVCCYTDPVREGHTSLTQRVEVWVLRQGKGERVKVTLAEFTFVALDESGKPRPIPRSMSAEACHVEPSRRLIPGCSTASLPSCF
jgi:acyl-CoA hydrolase